MIEATKILVFNKAVRSAKQLSPQTFPRFRKEWNQPRPLPGQPTPGGPPPLRE